MKSDPRIARAKEDATNQRAIRIIRISCCYNCFYRGSFMNCGRAIWVCKHPKRGGRQIGSAMERPPEWCPFEKEVPK